MRARKEEELIYLVFLVNFLLHKSTTLGFCLTLARTRLEYKAVVFSDFFSFKFILKKTH